MKFMLLGTCGTLKSHRERKNFFFFKSIDFSAHSNLNKNSHVNCDIYIRGKRENRNKERHQQTGTIHFDFTLRNTTAVEINREKQAVAIR